MTHLRLLDMEAKRKKKQAESPNDESEARQAVRRILDYLEALYEQNDLGCIAVSVLHGDRQTAESTIGGPIVMNDMWLLKSVTEQLVFSMNQEISFMEEE